MIDHRWAARLLVSATLATLGGALSGCATTRPSCARVSDCSSGLACHLGRCVARLDVAPQRSGRLVLEPTDLYFATDDAVPDATLDPVRNTALYLAFPPLPKGIVESAVLALPLRDDGDESPGVTALSVANILEPWTTRDAERAGPPRTAPPFETLRQRPVSHTFRLDVTAFVRRAQRDGTRGFAIRAEHVGGPVTLGTGAYGSPTPTLDLYLR